jgi:hypothetical protein
MTRGRGGRKGPANFGQWRRVPLYFERHRIKEPRRQLMRSAIQIADLLDELGQLPSEVAAALMYMFGNGLGKSRATRNGEARRTAEWRGVLLSTGEVGIASKIEELGRGRKAKAGQLVRLLDVPADSGKGRGLFDDCQGGPAAEFAQRLRVNAMTTYGTAGPAFVAHLAHSFGQDLKQCKVALHAGDRRLRRTSYPRCAGLDSEKRGSSICRATQRSEGRHRRVRRMPVLRTVLFEGKFVMRVDPVISAV